MAKRVNPRNEKIKRDTNRTQKFLNFRPIKADIEKGMIIETNHPSQTPFPHICPFPFTAPVQGLFYEIKPVTSMQQNRKRKAGYVRCRNRSPRAAVFVVIREFRMEQESEAFLLATRRRSSCEEPPLFGANPPLPVAPVAFGSPPFWFIHERETSDRFQP
jgi:hypothetical protein